MRSGIVPGLALAVLALTDASLMAQPRGRGGDPSPGRFGWLSSLEQGKAQAMRSGKPLMVVLRCEP